MDYSEKAIELAIEISKERGLEGCIEFKCANVVTEDHKKWAGQAFDVVLDKGTFDAICLCDELLEDGRRVADSYAQNIVQTVKPGRWFVITSCNWTEEELRRKIEGVGGMLHLVI